MFKKTIQYTDYADRPATGVFYFNLSTAELVKLEMSTMFLSEDGETTTGGLQQSIQDVIDSRSGKRIIEMFDMFIDASYGVRSDNGLKFTKNAEVLSDFKSTPAYDALFMELVTDAKAGAKFVAEIMPPQLMAQAEALKATQAPEGDEGIKGQSPTLSIVDEMQPVDATPHLLSAEDFRPQDKPKSGKNMTKAVIAAKMKIKQGMPVRIDDELMDALTADELNQAMENGSTLA